MFDDNFLTIEQNEHIIKEVNNQICVNKTKFSNINKKYNKLIKNINKEMI